MAIRIIAKLNQNDKHSAMIDLIREGNVYGTVHRDFFYWKSNDKLLLEMIDKHGWVCIDMTLAESEVK